MSDYIVGVDLASGPDYGAVMIWRTPVEEGTVPSGPPPGLAALDALLAEMATLETPPDVMVLERGSWGYRMLRYANAGRYHRDRRGRTWRKGPCF